MDISQSQISQFMQIAGQERPSKPTIAEPKVRQLRIKLILEELLELTAASGLDIVVSTSAGSTVSLLEATKLDRIDVSITGECDLVEVADALGDIEYVNTGAAVAYGINLKPIFEEIHRSNMTKLWTGEDVRDNIKAIDGRAFYVDKQVYVSMLSDVVPDAPETPRCMVVTDISGKLVKSPSYEKANLKAIIEAQLHA